MEMQCHCPLDHETKTTTNRHVPYKGACPETIAYKHHDDWGCEEDYMCEKCMDKCLDKDNR